MDLIRGFHIQGFRSLKDIRIEDVSGFTVFAGLNNSGKSNILRALNAFFNGETDNGVRLDVDSDYHLPDLKKKQTKQISVGVTFELPEIFKHRENEIEERFGRGPFEILKRWDRNDPIPTTFIDGVELSLDDNRIVDRFLQLIKFRYVPNRVLPIETIRGEQQALKRCLIRRLKLRGGAGEATFESMQDTSVALIREMLDRFKEGVPEIGTIQLTVPKSLAEMTFDFSYKIGDETYLVADVLQGAGVQSELMLESLYLVDTDLIQTSFGWRQGIIWALEEPESSLHNNLEVHTASFLSDISVKDDGRFQVLCSTHSDVIVQYADKTIIVRKDGWVTECDVTTDSNDAIKKLSREGISGWTHPLLYYPTRPILLVEGKRDCDFLEQALNIVKPSHRIRVAYVESLDPTFGTGGSTLHKYVKANLQPIRVRGSMAPVTVLLDWDASNSVRSFTDLDVPDDLLRCVAWPDSATNPRLGRSFRGIERCFSDRIIDEAIRRGAPIEVARSGNYSHPELSTYNTEIKPILNTIVQEGITEEDLIHAVDFLKTLTE